MGLVNAIRRLNSSPRHGRAVPRLLLVSDPLRLPDPAAAAARLPPGAGLLLRPYRGSAGAKALARLCRRRRLLLLVAADWRLAARLGADGLHLPEGLARHGLLAPALGWVRRHHRLLTVAAHGPAALARAGRLGADAALVSPVFPTRSHPGAATLGPLRLGLWRRYPGPARLALGGLTTATARRLPPGAVSGIAAIGSLTLGMSRGLRPRPPKAARS